MKLRATLLFFCAICLVGCGISKPQPDAGDAATTTQPHFQDGGPCQELDGDNSLSGDEDCDIVHKTRLCSSWPSMTPIYGCTISRFETLCVLKCGD